MSIDHLPEAQPIITTPLETEKKKGFTLKQKVAAGVGGLAVLIGAGAGIKSLTSGGDHTLPTADPTPEVTQDYQSPEPTPVASGDYGPAGTEKAQFESSIEIPSTANATEIGERYVNVMSTISNVGEDKGALDIYNGDISLIISDFSKDFVNDWEDEFSTVFDKSSTEYNTLIGAFTDGATAYTQYYLETVQNNNANAVFHEELRFVSASEEEAVDSDRQILITYHAVSNLGDTGVSTLGNVDSDATVRVKFTEDDGRLLISSVEAVNQ